jgi:hypothetical protein
MLECECTECSRVEEIEANACREGGQVDFIVSVRRLVPFFVYELQIHWTLEADDLTHTWKLVVTNDTDSYTLRQPLQQMGPMVWDAYKKGNQRFFIDVTVCDMYPGLTTEEALVGIRRVDSSVNTVRLTCAEGKSGESSETQDLQHLSDVVDDNSSHKRVAPSAEESSEKRAEGAGTWKIDFQVTNQVEKGVAVHWSMFSGVKVAVESLLYIYRSHASWYSIFYYTSVNTVHICVEYVVGRLGYY